MSGEAEAVAADDASTGAATPAAPAPLSATEAWAEALERMERELHRALAKVEPVPWRPPIALGPLPPELHERATRLLEAQLHTIRYLEDVRQTTAKHLAAVKAVPRAEIGPHPVYFDLIG